MKENVIEMDKFFSRVLLAVGSSIFGATLVLMLTDQLRDKQLMVSALYLIGMAFIYISYLIDRRIYAFKESIKDILKGRK